MAIFQTKLNFLQLQYWGYWVKEDLNGEPIQQLLRYLPVRHHILLALTQYERGLCPKAEKYLCSLLFANSFFMSSAFYEIHFISFTTWIDLISCHGITCYKVTKNTKKCSLRAKFTFDFITTKTWILIHL